MRPAHHIARTNLRSPPTKRICRKHSGPHERPLASGRFDQPLDLLEHRSEQIGLLEQRVLRFDWS